jgi:hypothetical protein
LVFSQASQQRYYNEGRLIKEFEEGDSVLINPHSLKLLGTEKGLGKKLLQKYDGPFKISEKLSPVTYRLKLNSNYKIHPVINIAHLEEYHKSPKSFGERPLKPPFRDIKTKPDDEDEVEKILAEQSEKQARGKLRKKYLVRWKEFDETHDEWIPENRLKNAHDVLRTWRLEQRNINKTSPAVSPS